MMDDSSGQRRGKVVTVFVVLILIIVAIVATIVPFRAMSPLPPVLAPNLTIIHPPAKATDKSPTGVKSGPAALTFPPVSKPNVSLKLVHVDKFFNCTLPGPLLFAMRHLMNVLADVFAEHKVLWWMDSGTLVGAMRLHAPLPWDDDGDIFIDADDFYEKRDGINASIARLNEKWGGDIIVTLKGWWGPGDPAEDRNWHQCPGKGMNMPHMSIAMKKYGDKPITNSRKQISMSCDIFLIERYSPRSCQIRQTCRKPWTFSTYYMTLFTAFDPFVVNDELRKETGIVPGGDAKPICLDNGTDIAYKNTINDLNVSVPNLRPELSLRKFARGLGKPIRMFKRDLPSPHSPNAFLLERFGMKKNRDLVNELAFSGYHDATLGIDFAGAPKEVLDLCCSKWRGNTSELPCPTGFINDIRLAPEIAARLIVNTLKAFQGPVAEPMSIETAPFDPSMAPLFTSACRFSLENWRACEAVFAADPMMKPLYAEIFNSVV